MPSIYRRLDNRKLGRSNVERIHIRRQLRECLLRAVRPTHPLAKRSSNTRFISIAYLIKVLIFTHSTSYNFFNASLICLLFALTSTMNTNVLFSSIFFIALSVFNGCTMTFPASRRGTCGTDLRGYLGARESCSVFGRWKEVVVRTLRTLCESTCCVKNRTSE